MEGGNLEEKGYSYRMYVTFPEISRRYIDSIKGNPQKAFILYFPSKIILTANQYYVKIEISLLGFGVGLEIQSKS